MSSNLYLQTTSQKRDNSTTRESANEEEEEEEDDNSETRNIDDVQTDAILTVPSPEFPISINTSTNGTSQARTLPPLDRRSSADPTWQILN